MHQPRYFRKLIEIDIVIFMENNKFVGLLKKTVRDKIIQAGIVLPEDVEASIKTALEDPRLSSEGVLVLSHIVKNLQIAEKSRLPMCQDTGMAVAFIDVGEDFPFSLKYIRRAVDQGVQQAYLEGSFRKSVVSDPLFNRENTGNNLPVVYHIQLVPGDAAVVHIMLKGFGSENCSGLSMLNPTDGAEGVVEAAAAMVKQAGGKPCPPVVLGIGIGGTAEQALLLSKRALFRKVGSPHQDYQYAELEKKILQKVNSLGIGPGGFGGSPTALGVMIEKEATHIAGMPLGVSISCWADRKTSIQIDSQGRIL